MPVHACVYLRIPVHAYAPVHPCARICARLGLDAVEVLMQLVEQEVEELLRAVRTRYLHVPSTHQAGST